MFEPVIKWSGSKRSQAEKILTYFPKEIDTYYEPFCGGASIMRSLIESDIKVNHYICSDLNEDLINLWNAIKNNPNEIYVHYKELWNELNKDEDISRRKEFYFSIRKRLNEEHSPLDFMFIMRTTFNGMPRYNKLGYFNSPLHLTRTGIIPEKLLKIMTDWTAILNDNNVEFLCESYEKVNPKHGDFVYLDPPYANTKGMYYGGIENNDFFDWIKNLNCKYILSFDGKTNTGVNNTYEIPEDIYSEHVYLESGNSSFRRLNKKSNTTNVYESLYIK